MSEDDKQFLKEFLFGGGFVGVVVGLFILFIAMLSGGNDKTPLEPHAEVVDTYKGCDIVRWNSHEFAEYKYFLHCNNTRPVYEQ